MMPNDRDGKDGKGRRAKAWRRIAPTGTGTLTAIAQQVSYMKKLP